MAERSSPETIGFIDVGTNSIHLLVVRFYPDTSGTAIFQDKESVRLGKSLYSTGVIDRESIEKSVLVISRFAQISKGLGADRVIAFATCAVREAENRQEIVDALEGIVELKVIPGPEEARLIALGVFGDQGPEERTIELDIGGGSTEVIIREKGEDIFVDSLSLGAVRFNYGLDIDCSKPVSQSDYDYMLRTVDISSYRAVNKIRSIGFRKAVGSSGTMIALAEMCAARRADKDASYFTLKELHSLMQDLRPMSMQQRLAVPGMGKSRADIIVPGGAIAEELMFQFGIQRIEVSQSGLKQGMMLDHQLSRGYTVFSARQSSVRSLAYRCQYDRRHAENVERNAMSLFDQSKEMGLHSLDAQWRSLLSCSAILHDIGELISYSNHHILSQVIIEKADLQGFTCEETRAMGLIVRFHHKKFPGPKDSRFEGIPKDEVQGIRVCAMLLKMADVMDRHRNGAIRSGRLSRKGDTVTLELSSDEDASMEIWSLEKIRPDFRRLFGLDLVPVSRENPSPAARADAGLVSSKGN
ncbi:MAG: Ppx/GppA phosphatase family protein [Thermoplasmata archaeon]|nr:Ppx/GppA phosphatase family protein [Thermoplasmata archaeon]